MKFTKMHGTGNDFIIIEDFENIYSGKEKELAKRLCDRHFGIGADGILLVRKSLKADVQMIIINSDGSYASMCGNGIRCFARYVWQKGIIRKDIISIETGDGIKEAYMNIENNEVASVKIYMGHYNLNPEKIPCTFDDEVIDRSILAGNKEYKITSMLMGVPHTVVVGKLDEFDVTEGKYIEKLNVFPEGTNVNFCEVVDSKRIRVKTWERGAGPTLACGTGSSAAVVASNKLGFVGNEVEVEVPGGILQIQLCDEGVFMSGPAVIVFEGEYYQTLV